MRKNFLFVIVLAVSALLFLIYDFYQPSLLLDQFKTLFLPKAAFLDVYKTSGIHVETPVAGAAWADYDNDGYLDLLLVGPRQTYLYKNKGDGTFIDVTSKAFGGDLPGGFVSGFFGDYDNDGCSDLFLVGYGPYVDNRLYHNNCNGTFTDVTKSSGIKKVSSNGFGAAWADYDNDGYLDLYVANYGGLGPNDSKQVYSYEPNQLYHNNGNGTFTEVAQKAGVSGLTNCRVYNKTITENAPPKSWLYKESLQPIWFDFNNDGKIDLFIATDAGISPLYKNNGDGTFTEVTKDTGLCKEGTGMGVAVGDWNNSGNRDIYVTNVGVNYLWHNKGDGTFLEFGAEAKVADQRTIGWGANFFDFNNDGNLDLYTTNGTVLVRDENGDPGVGKIMLDKLYKNNGKGTFVDVAADNGIAGDYSKGAAAFGDFNNDGFVDFVVLPNYASQDRRIKLYKNQSSGHDWLTIKLIGTKSNRDAVGARITLKSSGKIQTREVISGSSFLSQNSLWQTFGLGKSSKADEVEIKWPSGRITKLQSVKSNQILTITEPKN